MAWASAAIADLLRGKTVTLTPFGNSMAPRVLSGQRCTVTPLLVGEALAVGDVVLCRIRAREYLHLVLRVRDGRYLIGNARGHENGWVNTESIFGRLQETR